MTIESTLKERGASSHQEGGDHYAKMQEDMQPWNVLSHWLTPEEYRGYQKGVAIAYLAREASKGGDMDIRKAIHHLQRLVEEFPAHQETSSTVSSQEPPAGQHAELRKSWRKGQLWQRMGPLSLGWSDVDGEPAWNAWGMYRRSPECKWGEPKEYAADGSPKSHLDLPVVELPASMRCGDAINVPPMEVPKPWYPDNGGWVEVPGSDHEMPGELQGWRVVEILRNAERKNKCFEPFALSACDWEWGLPICDPGRIVAYKVV